METISKMKITIYTDEGKEYPLRQFKKRFGKLQKYYLVIQDIKRICKLNPKNVKHRRILFSSDWLGFNYLIEEYRSDTDIIDTLW